MFVCLYVPWLPVLQIAASIGCDRPVICLLLTVWLLKFIIFRTNTQTFIATLLCIRVFWEFLWHVKKVFWTKHVLNKLVREIFIWRQLAHSTMQHIPSTFFQPSPPVRYCNSSLFFFVLFDATTKGLQTAKKHKANICHTQFLRNGATFFSWKTP